MMQMHHPFAASGKPGVFCLLLQTQALKRDEIRRGLLFRQNLQERVFHIGAMTGEGFNHSKPAEGHIGL